MAKSSKNVENNVENIVKITRKSFVKLCKTFSKLNQYVKNLRPSRLFQTLPTIFSTTLLPLTHPSLSHFFTTPTTKTTIYNIIIVKKGISKS